MRQFFLLFALIVLLAGCRGDDSSGRDVDSESGSHSNAESSSEPSGVTDRLTGEIRETVHQDGDDLITAGLGLEGLLANAPEPADPLAPTVAELRRLAIYSSWRGLSALNPAGGVGGLIDTLPSQGGREFMAFLTLPERTHPARVLLQLPDNFDTDAPCLVVAPASGSRGVYGAVPMVAPWALPRGCAVVYTDKGAGTDFFVFADNSGVGLDGRRVSADSAELGLHPAALDNADDTIAMAHAHSGDHPEADWGDHVLNAVMFGLQLLNRELDTDISSINTQVIAAGLSNGGGAVLRAAERDEQGLIDGVVAVMPNISAPGVPHLFELGTLAALYQPCLLGDLDYTMSLVLGNPLLAAGGRQRCAALVAAGQMDEAEPAQARERLAAAGFDEAALGLAPVNVALDLWRAVAVTYASAYLGRGPLDMPCGYQFSVASADPAQRQAWWATHSGIAPGGGITLVDGMADGRDPALPGLLCLRDLLTDQGEDGQQLRAAIEATRATAQPSSIPIVIVHGRDDGLIPPALTSRPWVTQARDNGATVAYWEVANAQHFDALLAAPGVGERLVPMLPYGWYGLDHIQAVLDGDRDLGQDRDIATTPAPAGQPLQSENLGLTSE